MGHATRRFPLSSWRAGRSASLSRRRRFPVAIKQIFRTFHLRFTHRSFVKTNGHWWCSSGVHRPDDDRYGAISVNLSEITTQSRDLGRRIPQWGKPLQRAVKPVFAPIRQPQLVGGLVLSLRNEQGAKCRSPTDSHLRETMIEHGRARGVRKVEPSRFAG